MALEDAPLSLLLTPATIDAALESSRKLGGRRYEESLQSQFPKRLAATQRGAEHSYPKSGNSLAAQAEAQRGRSLLERKVFPGGWLFAAVASELDTRPGHVIAGLD